MKGIYKYLMLFIVAATISVSFVAAAELAEHNFDGNFKALAPKDANFEVETEDGMIIFFDEDLKTYYFYVENEDLNEDTINAFYRGFTKSGTFEKTGSENDLTFFKVTEEGLGSNAVATYTDGKILIVTGDDMNQLKEIAKSVKWN